MASCGVLGLTYPPSARYGTLPNPTSGKSNPKWSPPITGTQSGTSKLKLFTFRTIELIPLSKPSSIPFISPITILIGPFAISAIPLNMPSKAVTIPFQAPSQSPEKTPLINCITPLNTVIVSFIKSAMVPTTTPTLFPIESNIAINIGPNSSDKNPTTGAIKLLYIVVAHVTISPTKSKKLASSGCKCSLHTLSITSKAFSQTG